MKIRLLKHISAAVCAVIIFAAQTAFCFAAKAANADNDYDEIIRSAFAWLAESRGVDEFTDGLTFGQSDWAAICYARLYGGEDLTEYADNVTSSAEELMRSDGFVKPTDLQRAAIILSAVGECSEELINAAAYNCDTLDRQGFNAWIWALIAANCSGIEAGEGALHTRADLAEYILSKQLPDGGFTLHGESADCDMTAAAVYALAPLCDNDSVSQAVERAADRLRELYEENGGFSSMGTENCESAAQAAIAFISAGYDEDDVRVSTAIAQILRYRQADGGFAHLPDGDSNGLATAQAIEALTALKLSYDGEQLFDASRDSDTVPTEEPTFAAETEQPALQETAEVSSPQTFAISGFHIKLALCAVLAAAGAAVVAAAIVKRKRAAAVLGTVLLVGAAGVWLLDIKTPEEYYSQSGAGGDITVTLTARCDTALANMDEINESVNPADVIPEDGAVIRLCEISLDEGATAFDALVMAARNERVRVDYSGSAYGVYVNGIGYIYEFGFGEMSGWIYRVNGEVPGVSAGAYTLSDGDFVEFLYTCDIGRDLDSAS